MTAIDRSHAQDVYAWWSKRVSGLEQGRAISASYANRCLCALEDIFEDSRHYDGLIDADNPFHGLRFVETKKTKRSAFPKGWVNQKLLSGHALSKINREARGAFFGMIETGLRPSEVANLRPEDIRLDAEIPHISIEERSDRRLSGRFARRTIPLTGVSLVAFRNHPEGFPRYMNNERSLGSTLGLALKVYDLMPSKEFSLRSLRTDLAARLKAKQCDQAVFRSIFGYHSTRPVYGEEAMLGLKTDALQSAAYPVPNHMMSAKNAEVCF